MLSLVKVQYLLIVSSFEPTSPVIALTDTRRTKHRKTNMKRGTSSILCKSKKRTDSTTSVVSTRTSDARHLAVLEVLDLGLDMAHREKGGNDTNATEELERFFRTAKRVVCESQSGHWNGRTQNLVHNRNRQIKKQGHPVSHFKNDSFEDSLIQLPQGIVIVSFG